jgi:hypothetical protein
VRSVRRARRLVESVRGVSKNVLLREGVSARGLAVAQRDLQDVVRDEPIP